ncbi:MAG: RimK family alpha-L-glutamate ligase [Planctomycetaceae bacterium]|nr:RimK family alpha-L-glutamate ligase [Planctomycetaceae bacterium]
MRIGVLGNLGSWYVADLRRAAAARGHELFRLDFRRLAGWISAEQAGVRTALPADEHSLAVERKSNGHSCSTENPPESELQLDQFDALIVRAMPPGSLEQVVFRMDVLHSLAEAGVCILNSPRSLECAIDKYLTTMRLKQAGLPVPPTVACETAEAALAAFDQFGGDVVVKPVFGSEGRGIVRVSDYELAFRTFRTLERTQSLLYVQQFIPHAGSDVRVLILDGQPLGAITRTASGDFRTNVACHGTAEPRTATAEENCIAIAAAAAVGVRFAGVDLLYDREGRCYVIEVNAVPGWRAFSRATGIDVALAAITSLEQTSSRINPAGERAPVPLTPEG